MFFNDQFNADESFIGQVFHSDKYGDYEVIEYLGKEFYFDSGTSHKYYNIKFKNTGFITKARLSNIKSGSVKDLLARTIAGVGYLGDTSDLVYNEKMYQMWNSMIDKCYNPNNKMYPNYGAKGVTVCERWHCLANFIDDFYKLPGIIEYMNADPAERFKFVIDKDIRQPNTPMEQKVYSPDTCCLVYSDYNVREAKQRYLIENNIVTSSEYLGVRKQNNENKWHVSITLNKKEHYLGAYDDEIAAANVYNYVANCCEYQPFTNHAPYMEINEALSHCISRKPIEFPEGVDTTNLTIPYTTHSRFYGVKKKRDHFYGLYHDKDETQVAGIYDSEEAAASAHNIYSRLLGDSKNKINKNDYEFTEMTLSEVMKHKCYTKFTEPIPMIGIIDDDEIRWYDEDSYQTKFPGVFAVKKNFRVEFEYNDQTFYCGSYSSREAALVVWTTIRKHFGLSYDYRFLTMSFEDALKQLVPFSTTEWPGDFNIKVNEAMRNNSFTNACQAAISFDISSMSFNSLLSNDNQLVQMTTSTNEPDDARRARCRAKYGIDFL